MLKDFKGTKPLTRTFPRAESENPGGGGQRPPGFSAFRMPHVDIVPADFRILLGRGIFEPRRGLGQTRAGFTPNPGGFLKKPAEARVYVRALTRALAREIIN